MLPGATNAPPVSIRSRKNVEKVTELRRSTAMCALQNVACQMRRSVDAPLNRNLIRICENVITSHLFAGLPSVNRVRMKIEVWWTSSSY